MFEPRLDRLPAPQQRLWNELETVPSGFVLYGGTALALRLGHRVSEDFDFFANQDFTPDTLEREVPFLEGSTRLQSSPNTLVSLVERGGSVKVSFFGGLALRRLQDPEPAKGSSVLVASLLDLAATKVKVVQDRAEAKDYLDIDRLLKEGVDLGQALAAAVGVYGDRFNPLLSLKALCFFGDGDLPMLPESVRTRLRSAASEVRVNQLPLMSPLRGGVTP